MADRASLESEKTLELRTRDRARKLISKINKALKKIEEDGKFTENVFVKGTNQKVKFFNKGPDNNWQNTLPKDIRLELEAELKNELSALGYL